MSYFINVDKVIKLNKNKLSKDEYLILKKCLDYKYTTEQISEMINLGYQATFQRKKNNWLSRRDVDNINTRLFH